MDDKLIRDCIQHSNNKPDKSSSQQESVPTSLCEWPVTDERLCFVITKSKSSSWAEDLYDCGYITERNRVYN